MRSERRWLVGALLCGVLAACSGGGTGAPATSDQSTELRNKRRTTVDSGATSTADAGTVTAAVDSGTAVTPVDSGTATTPADSGSAVAPADAGSTITTASGGPAGSVPAGLPNHLAVGLFEEAGKTWMASSGVHWDIRYAYFTYGWLNNWGWSAADGSWGYNYMVDCANHGFIPGVQWYVVNGEAPAYNESAFLSKVQSPSTMNDYFNQFKVLMQRAKDFGKPVVVMLEGDGFGYLELQSNDNPSAYAAVAASGVPELSTLPNTVAGWGQAFLQLRKAVGATNVILGVDVAIWADGSDIAYFTVTDDLSPHVDTVYNFLAPLGLAANSTGATFDLLVNDPLDRDSDYYRISQNQDRWWDASDTASIDSKSFNRYAEWLRLWNQKAGKRWAMWQVPIGNSNSPNTNNNDNGTPGGYKDNRAEYFFKDVPSGNTTHLQKFANNGVAVLLYGRGATGQSNFDSDFYTDGLLFLKSRAGPFINAGGLPLP